MKRCIFVDGSPVVRQVANRILSKSDFIVIEAGTGGEALDMCSVEMPDYIVVDASLSDMRAEEFIRRVRLFESLVRPGIVLCLTEKDVGAIMRARRAGARSYLLKPFTRAQLLDSFRILQAA